MHGAAMTVNWPDNVIPEIETRAGHPDVLLCALTHMYAHMHVLCLCVYCCVWLTQWGAVCDQNVCVVRDLVPLVQQSLTPGQVKAPAIVPGLPADTQTEENRLVRHLPGVTRCDTGEEWHSHSSPVSHPISLSLLLPHKNGAEGNTEPDHFHSTLVNHNLT